MALEEIPMSVVASFGGGDNLATPDDQSSFDIAIARPMH